MLHTHLWDGQLQKMPQAACRDASDPTMLEEQLSLLLARSDHYDMANISQRLMQTELYEEQVIVLEKVSQAGASYHTEQSQIRPCKG